VVEAGGEGEAVVVVAALRGYDVAPSRQRQRSHEAANGAAAANTT
jgi:hypothetical protein